MSNTETITTPSNEEHAMTATCTITTTARGGRCGRPAVTSWTSSRGETFHECAEHAVTIPETPEPEVAEHPRTTTTRSHVLVKAGRIVGFTDSPESTASKRRALVSGGRWVKVVR